MNKHCAVIVLAVLLGLTGCAGIAKPAPAQPAKPVLSEEARVALVEAEAKARAARAGFTLWLPAEDALKKARAAALAYDSATVIAQARIVSELCRISALQPGYPTVDK